MMAVMLVASATAFAGDSDALKAILKAKTYAEAEQLVKSSIDQLANAQEKAKAYNKLVDLAYEAFSEQSTIQTENQVAQGQAAAFPGIFRRYGISVHIQDGLGMVQGIGGFFKLV